MTPADAAPSRPRCTAGSARCAARSSGTSACGSKAAARCRRRAPRARTCGSNRARSAPTPRRHSRSPSYPFSSAPAEESRQPGRGRSRSRRCGTHKARRRARSSRMRIRARAPRRRPHGEAGGAIDRSQCRLVRRVAVARARERGTLWRGSRRGTGARRPRSAMRTPVRGGQVADAEGQRPTASRAQFIMGSRGASDPCVYFFPSSLPLWYIWLFMGDW